MTVSTTTLNLVLSPADRLALRLHAVPATAPAPALTGRESRMRRLLGVVVLLSAVDLLLTIGFMQTVGMYEANPIVHLLIEWTGSPLSVAVFKIISVACGVGVLHRLRRHRPAEIGAWVGAAVLIGVCLLWIAYAWQTAGICPSLLGGGESWIRFD